MLLIKQLKQAPAEYPGILVGVRGKTVISNL